MLDEELDEFIMSDIIIDSPYATFKSSQLKENISFYQPGYMLLLLYLGYLVFLCIRMRYDHSIVIMLFYCYYCVLMYIVQG